jgi:hypothetical protein
LLATQVSSLDVALIGAVGVIIGGVITAGSNLLGGIGEMVLGPSGRFPRGIAISPRLTLYLHGY